MIDILYSPNNAPIEASSWKEHLSILPLSIREKISRFHKWEDRQSALYGKLLLLEGLKKYGLHKDCLNNLSYNQWGKPFLENGPIFNISHSGNVVICAISKDIQLGIDVEKVDSKIDLTDFNDHMSKEQWAVIHESTNPHQTFFSYWVIKESVIKAEGRGLSIPLTDIHIKNSIVDLYGTKWHVKTMQLFEGYACSLAYNGKENPNLSITPVVF